MSTTKKQRNYTIDFYRFLFGFSFVIGHTLIITFRTFTPKETGGLNFSYDTLLVFTAFAGYFMMQNFKRQQVNAIENNISPVNQAFTYLKSRLKGLGPMFVFVNLFGFVAMRIWLKTPITDLLDAFLNHLPEFFGLYLTGLGMGTNYDGLFGELPAEFITLCQPVWFVSGLFIASYILYYLLAKNEKLTLGIIVPCVAIFFYGSLWIKGSQANWPNFFSIGDLKINAALIEMFCQLGFGCIIWTAVDALKGKEFKKPAKIVVSIIQGFLMILMPIRTFIPMGTKLNPFTFGWPASYIIALIFTFLVLLNKDYATKVLNRKIFGVLGGLSMHLYMIHWPIIILVNALVPSLVQNSLIGFIDVIVVLSMVAAAVAKKVDGKVQKRLSSGSLIFEDKEIG